MRRIRDLSTTGDSGAPFAVVSAADYVKLAIAHIQTRGQMDAEGKRWGFVVREREQPAQWRAWIAYADVLSPVMGRTWRALKALTVPTPWPIEFDLSAPNPPLHIPDPPVSPARRKELANMLRALVADWDTPGAPTWRGAPDARHVLDARTAPTPELRAQAVAYHEKRLDELARIYAASDDDARRQQDVV